MKSTCLCLLSAGLVLSAGCGTSTSPPRQEATTSEFLPARLAGDRPAAQVPAADEIHANEAWATQYERVATGEAATLQLTEQAIGDEQLEDLIDLPASATLQQVLLDAGQITDAGFFVLARFPLEHLRLRHSPITDEGLQQAAVDPSFAPLRKHLRVLNLPQATLTAAGVRALQAFPALQQLRIGGQGIDDQAVAEIARIPNLRSLHLIAPQLTGQALDQLAAAPKLASLYIDQCPLDDQAWQRLFSVKPNLHVHIDQAHHDLDPKAHPH